MHNWSKQEVFRFLDEENMAGMGGEHVMLILDPDTWYGFDYS